MSTIEETCRLCMNTEAKTNLFSADGDLTLDKKITACIDLKITIGDGLPAVICKLCENNVKTFYDFKQKCLFIDSKLRNELAKNAQYSPNKSTLDGTDLDSIKMDIKLECEIFNKMDSELKKTFDSWLSDDADSAFYVDYFDKFSNQDDQVAGKEEQNEATSGIVNNVPQHDDKKVQPNKQTKKLKEKKLPKIYQCEICGRILKNKSVLLKHIASHSGIKQFSCEHCPKRFTRAEHMVIHMRIHLGIKPYVCEVCGRSFTKRQDLVRHMRIHSDDKNYACPRCDRRFKRSGDVHSHLRTHTGAKPYSCNVCDKSYTSHSGLRKHYKSHCKRENTIIK
ncbi:zinc finger protein 271-like [Leguminivora glycinivorella]|uniref:zinc finger protein 271-like n=1 Tax=Leguminivora glycinivorella TaxID=1035111 RepID=UPI00200BBE78|nr:zinc finger protein 271-like [Leguminivora glycinivorella]